MNKEVMSYSFMISGTVCGFDSSLYLDSSKNVITTAGTLAVSNESLENLLMIIGAECYEFVSPFVKLLGKFELDASYYHKSDCTVVKVDVEQCHFVEYDGLQGKVVMFSLKVSDFKNTENGLKNIISNITRFFGIAELQFLYRSNDISSTAVFQNLVHIPKIPITVQENVILSTIFKFKTVGNSEFTRGISELFGIDELDLYVGVSGESFSCTLCIPDMVNELLTCRDIIMSCTFNKLGVNISMRGIISLTCISNIYFVIACNLTMDSFSISASTMTGQLCTLPETCISIYDSALLIGVDTQGLNFGIMTTIAIRELSMFGALKIAYQGESATLEMISAAMSEISLPSLVKNLTGLNSDSLSSLDIISIMPFDLHTKETLDPDTMYDLSDAEIVAFANKAISQLNKELTLSVNSVSIKRFNEGIEILDTLHMFHYYIDARGILCMTPQFYYSVSTFWMGKYLFQKGTFFCGELNLFGFIVKVIFSALDAEGIMGFAQFSPIETKFLKITASKTSATMGNPVLGSGENNVMTLLVEPIQNSPILFVNVHKNECGFYIDGHFELCKVFAFDALMYYIDKRIRISTGITYLDSIRASLYLDASYKKFSDAFFFFQIKLDCTEFQENLLELTKIIDECIKAYSKKINDAKVSIENAKAKVSMIQNEITQFNNKIQNCNNIIKNTRKIKRWLVAIREGIKILSYETAIVGLKIAMSTALGILSLAGKMLDVCNRLGVDVLSAINKVITSAMKAFFIRLAILEIQVNGESQYVYGGVDLTLLGKDIKVEFECDLSALINEPIKFIEDEIIKAAKAFFNQVSDGSCTFEMFIEASEDDFYDDMASADMVEAGVRKLDHARNMITDLESVYLNVMKDIPPEFENIDKEYQDSVMQANYSLDVADSSVDLQSIDEIISVMKEQVDGVKGVSAEDEQEITEIEESYLNELRPTLSSVAESSQRIQKIADSIEVEQVKELLRSVREENEEKTGCETMSERDYEKLYNDMQAVITQYFPPGTGEGYFNFTDEEEFYNMLNEAREEADCPTAPVENERFMERGKVSRFRENNYRPRFVFTK